MSSRRDRSRSRSPRSSNRERESRRDYSDSKSLPHGARMIEESDYFQKSSEFRSWLKDDRGKFLDELTSERSRSYFRKFVKKWNKGDLPANLYSGIDPATETSSSLTAYKWAFASNRSKVDKTVLQATREDVASATYKNPVTIGAGPSTKRTIGPSMPPPSTYPQSSSDAQLAREDRAEEAKWARKRERAQDRERVEDAVGPKEVGREGALEKKRARRDADRDAKNAKDDGGLEVGDDVLMGSSGGDSFKARIAQRDAAKQRFDDKRQAARDASGATDRMTAMREKEKKTMEMFANMAKERFG